MSFLSFRLALYLLSSERRDNYVPEVSALEDEQLLAVDPQVTAMIKSMDFENKDGLLEALKSESS